MPSAQVQFTDSNGVPLSGAQVFFYVPGTTTPKTTFQDPGLTVPNANPVVLNSAGRAVIWGSGQYRQILVDQFGTTIWDQLTAAPLPSQSVVVGGDLSGTLPNPTVVSTHLTAPQTVAQGGTGNSVAGTGLFVSSGNKLGALLNAQVRFNFVSTTSVALVPYNGQFIQIQGATYTVPTAGVTSANTNTFVNGVSGQNLAASTLYFVYVFNNSGALALDFSTTGYGPDNTPGNVGVEIEAGNASRSLVGLVSTSANTPGQFVFTQANRQVLSWFNRRPIRLIGAGTANATLTSASFVEINAASEAFFLNWAEDNIRLDVNGAASDGTADAIVALSFGVGNATPVATASQAQNHTAGNLSPLSTSAPVNLTDGLHFATPVGSVSAGTGTYSVALSGNVWY